MRLSLNNYIKSLPLVTEQGDYWIKVAKEIRKSLGTKLQPGCFLKVTGMRKNKIHQGVVEYKAYKIELIDKPVSTQFSNYFSNGAVATKPKAKVLFCQKSTCWKSGGKAACESLKTELKNQGIADRVEVKTVGCLKQCKQAPNMVIMPDKVRYSKVHPKQVSALIEKHLLTNH